LSKVFGVKTKKFVTLKRPRKKSGIPFKENWPLKAFQQAEATARKPTRASVVPAGEQFLTVGTKNKAAEA
jgi:hypothetical protein